MSVSLSQNKRGLLTPIFYVDYLFTPGQRRASLGNHIYIWRRTVHLTTLHNINEPDPFTLNAICIFVVFVRLDMKTKLRSVIRLHWTFSSDSESNVKFDMACGITYILTFI